jgi:IS30 family transposase
MVEDSSATPDTYTTHFIDLATSFRWLKFSKDKKDAQKIVKEWATQIEAQTGLKIQAIGIDGGSEFGQATHLFYHNPLKTWANKRGTLLHINPAHSPWFNGASERSGGIIKQYASVTKNTCLLGVSHYLKSRMPINQ